MKTGQELVIGSAIFLLIDRVVRVLSSRLSSSTGTNIRETSLHAELLILILVILITWRVF